MSPTMLAFLENESALKRFLGRILPTAADVEDVAQEALLRAFVASSTETVLMPKAFLFRIARNLAINERARMWNTTTTLVGNSSELDGVGFDERVSSEDRLDSDRKMMIFQEAISQLPTKCQQVFVLRKVHELSYKEIADRMGISVSTVEKHIAMGLARCSDYLSERGYDVGELPVKERVERNNGRHSNARMASRQRASVQWRPRSSISALGRGQSSVALSLSTC